MTGHQTSTSRVIHVGAADKVHMRAEYKRARACGCEFPCPLVQFMYENRSVAKADSAVTEGKLRKIGAFSLFLQKRRARTPR
jgi:hypothetical protein